MADPYDMRSNIKGKPGSQGTLFQISDKSVLNQAQRWPKGYAPERRREVADAVVMPSVHNYTDRPQEIRTGTQSANFSDRKVRGGYGLYNESRQPVRDLVDNIARSTVPVEHLGGVQWRHNAEKHLTSDTPGVTTLGHYDRAGDALSKGRAVIRLRTGQEGDFVPIHEIGHHVSLNEGMDHSEYKTGQQQGREEAFADRYAFEHYRTGGRKSEPMQDLRMYPTPGGDPQRSMNFASAYHAGRGDIPVPDPMAKYNHPAHARFREGKEAEANRETLFRTWDYGDQVDFETHPEVPAVGVPVATTKVLGWTPKGKRRG